MSEPISEAIVDPDETHFAQVSAGVYRRVEPESVWRAIQYAVRHQLPAQNPTIMILFVRIAEVHASVQSFLETCVNDADPAETSALKLILDPPLGIRDAEYIPAEIETLGEMDLCWGEFLVTGSLEVVERIVTVLDREDRSRANIERLLNDDASPLELTETELHELASVGIGIGRIDGPWSVMSPGDIDVLLCFGLKGGSQACSRIVQAMDEADQIHLSAKGAAIWSLRANAEHHGKIRLFCDTNAEKPGGLGRRLLVL